MSLSLFLFVTLPVGLLVGALFWFRKLRRRERELMRSMTLRPSRTRMGTTMSGPTTRSRRAELRGADR